MKNHIFTAGYSLVTIEEITDEETALAAAPHATGSYLGPTLAAMALIALVCAVLFYLHKCFRMQKRIKGLDAQGSAYRGWNLRKLKETVAELEAESAAQMHDFACESV